MPNPSYINQLRTPTKEHPLRILMSACLGGVACGYDGSAYGTFPSALHLMKFKTVKVFKFCPEEFSFGSPREMCDIHGGDGFDVLDGKAKLLSESGVDWTPGILKAAEAMLALAKREAIELAVMMDISAACGSQVIYNGNRFGPNPSYQIGVGVAAALLMRNNFQVISQRDFASLEILNAKIDPHHKIDPNKIDHHETEWYKNYFQKS
jgi:uncharacterized protein YbbK (DUF523 family)